MRLSRHRIGRHALIEPRFQLIIFLRRNSGLQFLRELSERSALFLQLSVEQWRCEHARAAALLGASRRLRVVGHGFAPRSRSRFWRARSCIPANADAMREFDGSEI